MPIFRCELTNGRRTLKREDRQIHNVKDGAEVATHLAAMAGSLGLGAKGHTLKIFDTSGRRTRLIRTLTG